MCDPRRESRIGGVDHVEIHDRQIDERAWSVRRAWPECCALGLLVLVRLWMGAWAPLIVPSDGLDYINAARWMADRSVIGAGSLDLMPPYKSPLMSMVLGCLYAVSDSAPVWYGAMQTALGVLTGIMAWAVAATVLADSAGRRWWALAAGLLVGLHPVLLGYEHVLLRESMAAFVVMLAVWVLSKLAAAASTRRVILLASALGAIVGAGALLRENFQTLVVLALPAVLLCVRVWKWRFIGVMCVVCAAGIVIGPWALRLGARNDVYGVCLPKMRFNQLLNGYNAGVINVRHTGLVESGRWAEVLRCGERRLSDYEFVAEVLMEAGVAPRGPACMSPIERVELTLDAMTRSARDVERACGEVVDRGLAADDRVAWAHRRACVVNQIGLWRPAGLAHGRANEWVLGALRGVPTATGNNYLDDVELVMVQKRFTPEQERLRHVVGMVKTDTSRVDQNVNARIFAAWYAAGEWLRPVVGWLGVCGVVWVCVRRKWVSVFAGVAALVNMVGAGAIALTPWDRASTPFLPVLCVLAVCGLLALIECVCAFVRRVA